VTLANANMAAAIRSRTVEKGRDPRVLTLVAFGGAGPLHGAEVAELLEVSEVLIPLYPGATSALGLLAGDIKHDAMRTAFMVEGEIDAQRVGAAIDEMGANLRSRLERDGVESEAIELAASIDCRYAGQGYELRVPLQGLAWDTNALERFREIHRREYGRATADPVELVNVRVTARARRQRAPAPAAATGSRRDAELDPVACLVRENGTLGPASVAAFDRERLPAGELLAGPALVFQLDSTVFVPPRWTAAAEPSGALILRR
jgi:N-methylhydantoinase A